MKQATLVILFLYFFIPVMAQSVFSGQQLMKRKCGTQRAILWKDKYPNYPELFNEIRVLDARPDTSRIGIVRTGALGQDEILFEMPVASQLTAYLNSAYARQKGGHSLLIVLKNLWIACPDNYALTRGYPFNFYFHVEAYLQGKEGFMPVISMDTTLREVKGETASYVAGKVIRALFAKFMERAAAVDLDKARRIVSAEQIDSFNQIRFAYPMDTAKLLLKGVYAGIEEFRNNAPSIKNAEMTTDNTGIFVLRVPDENGQLYYTHTAWGYCDGRQSYVMMDGNLFPIFIIYHQFYVLGSKQYQISGAIIPLYILLGNLAPAAFSPSTASLVRSLRLFRLDMETGQVVE